jgi:hypothetical protein
MSQYHVDRLIANMVWYSHYHDRGTDVTRPGAPVPQWDFPLSLPMLPRIVLENLEKIEPGAQFSGNLPKVQSSAGQSYFAKLGSPSEYEQYLGEARSLEAISAAAPGLAPAIIAYGNSEDGKPFFISEYKSITALSSGAPTILAKRLATELHQYKSHEGYGFEIPTFCGATRQKNGWYKTWEQCYSNLIGNLLEGLSRRDYGAIVVKGERIQHEYVLYHRANIGATDSDANEGDSQVAWYEDAVSAQILLLTIAPGKLKIEPVLLHGDLWVLHPR